MIVLIYLFLFNVVVYFKIIGWCMNIEKDREDIQRKPATRASWIQKQILNERPYPRHKPTEGEI